MMKQRFFALSSRKLLKTIALGLMAMVGVNAWADGVSRINYWDISSNWSSTRTNGSTSYDDGVLTVNSGTDNDKRGDIKNTSNSGISIGANKVIFYEIECTADGASMNANDMKFGYTAKISAFDADKEVVNEQVVKSAYQTVNSTHTLVYFDLSTTNANVAYFSGDANNKFSTDQKNSYRTALTAATAVTISSPNFTLIGSATTNFKIYKMGSAKSVNALLAEYGIKPIYNVTQDLAYNNNALNTAVSAATDGDEIELNGDVEVSSNFSFGKGLTIVPVNADRTITISTSLTGSYFAFGMSTASKTVEIGSDTYGLTFDGQSTTLGDRKLFEVTNGQVKFKKVTFENVYTSSSQGVLCVKSNSGANITLTDVAFNGCQATASGAGVIFCGTDDALVLSGNNTFSNCTGYGLYLEKRFKVDETNGVTNTIPITIFVKTTNIASADKVVATKVLPSEVSKFVIMNEGYGIYRTASGRGDMKTCEGHPITITDAGAATLVLPFAATIPDGVTCYILTHTSGSSTVTAEEVTGGTLAAKTPVLINAAKGYYNFKNSTNATTATAIPGSPSTVGALTGVYADLAFTSENIANTYSNAYILNKIGDNVGFYKAANGKKVGAYKAYLTATNVPAGAGARLSIVFDDSETTALKLVNSEKGIVNNEYYDLQGRRVAQPTKGLYIVNGKKVVIK